MEDSIQKNWVVEPELGTTDTDITSSKLGLVKLVTRITNLYVETFLKIVILKLSFKT